MENDCINLYKDRLCWLTAHHAQYPRRGELVLYVCAYPHNCQDCKDYKPKEKKDRE